MPETGPGRFDADAFAIALGLLALAALVAYDASTLQATQIYASVGPRAVPYVVAGGLSICGVLTAIAAFRGVFPAREPDHWGPVAWIAGGLLFQILAIAYGGGFILATAVLFAATSRAFGRKALAVDFLIGLALGTGVYLLFTKVLTLSLPQGPLEHLL